MTLARVNSTCVIRFHNAFFEEVMHEGGCTCSLYDEKNCPITFEQYQEKRIFELFVVTDYCAGGV
jgi:hypothetical protein